MSLEERRVQVTLLEGFGVPPPVPALTHAAVIPELRMEMMMMRMEMMGENTRKKSEFLNHR